MKPMIPSIVIDASGRGVAGLRHLYCKSRFAMSGDHNSQTQLKMDIEGEET